MLYPVAILAVFLLGVAAPWLRRGLKDKTGWVLAPLPAFLALYFYLQFSKLPDSGPSIWGVDWVPSIGLSLSFYVDGLSLLFLTLIAGIGSLVLIYAKGYLGAKPDSGRFFFLLMFFMASMLGIVSAGNLLLLFVFWELTSISSYLLIGTYAKKPEARAAALQAILVTGGGGLVLLAGIIILGWVAGSFEIPVLMERGDAVRSHAFYPVILGLVFIGAFTKSAQVPFHFWLPGAMEAPAPVSSYLHSATMVKAGLFLLARLNPVLGGTDEWSFVLTWVGVLTMVTGSVLAVWQDDLKKLLAYSTISALGTIMTLFGIGTSLSFEAAIVFLIVHSLYKGSLFMVAGSIDQGAGTRNVNLLGGLVRCMPMTAMAATLAALSMSGFPPLLGFIGKELLYEAQLASPFGSIVITVLGVLANAVTVAVAFVVGVAPFAGRTKSALSCGEAPASMWVGPALLAGMGLLAGLFPDFIGRSIVAPAVSAVRAEPTQIDLKLWHGFNVVFLLSIATVACGALIFFFRTGLIRHLRLLTWLAQWGPQWGYERLFQGVLRFADWQTRVLLGGTLSTYISVTLLAIAGLVLVILALVPQTVPWNFDFSDIYPHEIILAALIAAGAILTTLAPTRFVAFAGLTSVGFGIAMTYVMYSAPDLAITQILVETLAACLFVYMLVTMPRFTPEKARNGRAILTSGLTGIAIAALTFKAKQVQLRPSIASYFAENSLPLAQGRNVVNVILVDFRVLDTFGEILVLVIAAVAIYTLRPTQKKREVS